MHLDDHRPMIQRMLRDVGGAPLFYILLQDISPKGALLCYLILFRADYTKKKFS